MEVIFLLAAGSNHWPICINIDINTPVATKPFIFEKLWLSHPDFADNIKDWWQETTDVGGTLMYLFQQRLKKIKDHIKVWNKIVFGNIHQAKKEMENKMANIQ